MHKIELYKICSKSDLVAAVKEYPDLVEVITNFCESGAVDRVLIACSVMEETPKGPVLCVELVSETLTPSEVFSFMGRTYPGYEPTENFYDCGFRITASTKSQIFREDSYYDITEEFT